MKMPRSSGNVFWSLAAITLLTACDRDGGIEPPQVASVTISPNPSQLEIGATVQLAATVLTATGSVLSGHPVTWASSRPDIASVSAAGLVRALVPGSTTVTAASEGRSGSIEITVLPGECRATHATGTIAPGVSTPGTLEATDCELFGSPADGYELDLSSSAMIRITMSAGQFPPFLVLTDRQMNQWAWGYFDGSAATLQADLPSGRYIVWATSSDARARGQYQISASEVNTCSPASATAVIAPGDTFAGTLGTADCIFVHGVQAVGFRMDLSERTSIRLDLSSTAFDPLLVITDLYMDVLWWNDDWGGTTDARIERRLPAGQYIVWVTSFDVLAAGAYELTVVEVEIPLCPTVGALIVGQSVTGTLAHTDCLIDGGLFADLWSLSVEQQTTVRIDLTSNDFDTFLVIEDEYGEVLAWDDDGGVGFNSRLVYTFPAGEYRVVVTSYWQGETGAYQLTALALAGAGPTGAAATFAAPRLPASKPRKR